MSAAAAAPPLAQAVLTCRAGGQVLALSLADVSEILPPRPLTRLPHAPPSLLGLANLRGSVVPVISLAALLGAAVPAVTPASRLVVLWPSAPVALLVDGVTSLSGDAAAAPLDVRALLARDFAALLRRSTALAAAAVAAVPQASEARQDRALITFGLAGRDFALPLAAVAEIARLPEGVAALPQTDAAMLGAIGFRGGLLPLVSLRLLLGLPAAGLDQPQARIVVTRVEGELVGLVVDAMGSILRVPEAAIDAVPPVLTRGSAEARIAAICRLEEGRRLVSLLATETLFDTATVARIRLAIQGKAAAMGDDEGGGEGDGEGGAMEQFVLFQLAGESYGLPIAAVEEVVRHPGTLTRIPRAPDFLEGVMNLRGKVVPVIDQRRRFAVEGAGAARGRRVIVVRLDGLLAGFAVDAVAEIIAVAAGDLAATPALAAEGGQAFDRVATGRDGQMVLIVDPRALLHQAERDLLAAIAAAAPAP